MEQQRMHVLTWQARMNAYPYEGAPPPPRWAKASGINKSEPALNRGGGKLTPSIVREIKHALTTRLLAAQIARNFGVSQTTISESPPANDGPT